MNHSASAAESALRYAFACDQLLGRDVVTCFTTECGEARVIEKDDRVAGVEREKVDVVE